MVMLAEHLPQNSQLLQRLGIRRLDDVQQQLEAFAHAPHGTAPPPQEAQLLEAKHLQSPGLYQLLRAAALFFLGGG